MVNLEELTKESTIPNFKPRSRTALEKLIATRQGNQVVNKTTGKQYGFVGRDSAIQAEKIYVGREFPRLGLKGSPLGNYEYRVKDRNLEEHNRAVTAYKSWFDKEMVKGKKSVAYQEVDKIADKLLQGKPIVLTCFCPKSLPCHARDVLEPAIIDRALEKQENSLMTGGVAQNSLSDLAGIKMFKKIEKIYSDGACSGNPGAGGWGCVVAFSDGSTHEIGGAESNTTNNQMELKGAIAGLEFLLASGQRETVQFYTDSQYVQNGITDWIQGWKQQGWRSSSGKPVKNQELWQQLDNLNCTLSQVLDAPIDWRHVEAHAGHIHNERCDAIAQACAASAIAVAFSKNKVPNLVKSDTPAVSNKGKERQSNNQKRLFPSINIYSKSPDWLGASLTNPTTVAEYWATKEQSGIKDKFPVFFGGNFWKDAEAAYQNFKQDFPSGSERDNLMSSIIEAKFNQYPELIKELDKRGGSAWLETCEHRVNGGFWEGKGKDSPFISALIKAYKRSSLRLHQKEADSTMTVAFSGSRAKYFNEHPDWEKRAKNSLKDMVKTAFDTAHSLNYDRLTFVTGMATGIDQWGAIEAMKLRKQQRQGLLPEIPKIEVLASVPCIGQEKVWNRKEKDRYFKLLSLADDVHLVSRESYKSPAQLFNRNDDMLNRLNGRDDMLLVVQVAGSRGTQDAIDKALAQGKEILLYEPDKKGTQSYTYFSNKSKSSTPPSSELAARLMAMERKQTTVQQAQFNYSPRSQEVEL